MNEQNLIPKTSDQSREEAKKNGRKGGIASGKARRDKRNFRDTLNELLSMPDKDKDGNLLLSPVTGKPMSIRESTIMQWMLKARKGDIKAIKLMLETLGERLLRAEETHEVNVTHSRYEGMTEDELIAETKRLNDAIENT